MLIDEKASHAVDLTVQHVSSRELALLMLSLGMRRFM